MHEADTNTTNVQLSEELLLVTARARFVYSVILHFYKHTYIYFIIIW